MYSIYSFKKLNLVIQSKEYSYPLQCLHRLMWTSEETKTDLHWRYTHKNELTTVVNSFTSNYYVDFKYKRNLISIR